MWFKRLAFFGGRARPGFFAGWRYVRFDFRHQMHAGFAKRGWDASSHSKDGTDKKHRYRSKAVSFLTETFRGHDALCNHLNNMGGRLRLSITSSIHPNMILVINRQEQAESLSGE